MPVFSEFYPWIKALHIIAVLFWMAAIFYLPRLFVYHGSSEEDSRQWRTFCLMERRLLNFIMTPSMIGAWTFGLILISIPGTVDFLAVWFYVKLFLVIAMTWIHALLLQWQRGFAAGQAPHSPRFFRVVNEIPPLLAIGVVILVVVRPF